MTADKPMTSRFDELFSPERLRQNWQMTTAPVFEPPQASFNLDIHARYHELQRLISEKFPDAARLSVKFDELVGTINQAFPLDDTAPDGTAKETAISLLEQLEELLWALDLSLEEQG